MTIPVRVALLALIPVGSAFAQVRIPAPTGYVNDFAGVLGAAHADSITRLITLVRDRTGGEITVVTMADIEGREANDVALRIGREWGVGSNAEVGNRARNAGVVILLVPRETASDGRGQAAIQVGEGAEGFIPDGAAGAIWREAIPLLRQANYGAAAQLMTYRVASRYADEFGFSLDSAGVAAPPVRQPRRPQPPPVGAVVFVLVMMLLVGALIVRTTRSQYNRRSRRDLGFWAWLALQQAEQNRRSRRSSGWHGGGFGGGGFGGFGGGGGGFGGFGGGGGFSGGGSGGSW